MFTFATSGLVFWPVNLVSRTEETGEPVDAPVLIQYRIYTRAELKKRKANLAKPLEKVKQLQTVSDIDQLSDGVGSIAADMNALDDATQAEVFARVMDWKRIVDANGDPIPFTKDTLLALCMDDAQYKRIAEGLEEASRGALAKNSLPGPAGSRAPARS